MPSNNKLKNKIINYLIFSILIFILLTVTVRYYSAKENCSRLNNYSFENGKCVLKKINESNNEKINNKQAIIPETKNQVTKPEPKNGTLSFYFETENQKKLIFETDEQNLPIVFKQFLIQIESKNYKAYDTYSGLEVDFYNAIYPTGGLVLQSIFLEIEKNPEAGYFPKKLTGITDVYGTTYITFGGYKAKGEIITINQKTGELKRNKNIEENPKVEKINNNYYITETDLIGCDKSLSIRKIEKNDQISTPYIIKSTCELGTLILNDISSNDKWILAEYFSPDAIEGDYLIKKLELLDITNMSKNLLFDFTKNNSKGVSELLNTYFTDGTVSLFSDTNNNVFILNLNDQKIITVQDFKLSEKIDIPKEKIKFSQGYFCIPKDEKASFFTLINKDGTIHNQTSNDICNLEDPNILKAKNTLENRLEIKADEYRKALVTNIIVEVN